MSRTKNGGILYLHDLSDPCDPDSLSVRDILISKFLKLDKSFLSHSDVVDSDAIGSAATGSVGLDAHE